MTNESAKPPVPIDSKSQALSLLQCGLEEDGVAQDWTTLCGLSADEQEKLVSAHVIAKEKCVWAGADLIWALKEATRQIGQSLEIHHHPSQNGLSFSKGDEVLKFRGPAKTVLAVERSFLNLLSYCCGVATRTSELVSLVNSIQPAPPRVTCTRKTLPLYRALAVASVVAGGGFPHRFGLSSGILVKENHIASASSPGALLLRMQESAPHGLKVEVEVQSLDELRSVLEFPKVEAVLLDNFTPEQVKEAIAVIQKLNRKVIVEVSGGLNEQTISQYAIPGVDVLSVGGLTHSVKAIDFSLLINDVESIC